MVPRATYRIQFRKEFGFDDAARLAPYLAELGISHVYASPYLKARAGSSHGYDIIDHLSLNPELGGQAAFERMVNAFKIHGLKQIVDCVPNHMGVGGADNPQWLDLLEWGRNSKCADWFDVDWDSHSDYLRGKLLVPFLGEQYGAVLSAGNLRLQFDKPNGEFAVWAYEQHKLPIFPAHYSIVLSNCTRDLDQLADEFSAISDEPLEAWRRAAELKKELFEFVSRSAECQAQVQSAVALFEGKRGEAETWTRLDQLIRKQHWRPAYFRVAADDINYRRFFNISELAGIRTELPTIFEQTHRLLFQLIEQGIVDGLRIDHIDGLLDPKNYLQRLRANSKKNFYLVVEKILAQHEALRTDWPIDGTTGYEFASQVMQLLVHPAAEQKFDDCYRQFTGESKSFAEVVYEAKNRIMDNELASEVFTLARETARVARQNSATSDFTENLFHRAIQEIIACFPVYRTYVDSHEAVETDRRYVRWAVAQASRNCPELDASVFEFLKKLLTGDLVRERHSGFSRPSVVRLAMRLQQLSGPVMAKAFEDTALFRFNRLAALNEVGSSPDQFGSSVAAFHKENLHRATLWPRTMLTTSTHDTKRGEDARARLAALSLVPEEWAANVNAWSRILRARNGDVEGKAPPSRNDEYLFFQNLVATWPAEWTELQTLDAEELRSYGARLKRAMVKSMREARIDTNWIAPNTEYEKSVTEFVSDALDPERSEAFFASFLPFEKRVAELGVRNSLAQVVLKLTSPGVPDFYQGSEFWDLSMSDPDNRREVDYEARKNALREWSKARKNDQRRTLEVFWQSRHNGHIKLAITHSLLEFRKNRSELLEKGTYESLLVKDADGVPNEAVCAFKRRLAGDEIVVVVSTDARLTRIDFEEQEITIADEASCEWQDVFTRRAFSTDDGAINVAEIFDIATFSVLVKLTK